MFVLIEKKIGFANFRLFEPKFGPNSSKQIISFIISKAFISFFSQAYYEEFSESNLENEWSAKPQNCTCLVSISHFLNRNDLAEKSRAAKHRQPRKGKFIYGLAFFFVRAALC